VTLKNTSSQTALGLYVHWPYCAHICPYCDFNVRRDRGQDTNFLVDAIITDIIGTASRINNSRPLTSVSFGGGTPSRMQPEQIRQILQAAEQVFGFLPDIEVSLEANPNDNKNGRFQGFAESGINRLSLGIQSLNPKTLKFLGRDHNVDDAREALEVAQAIFPSVSADFIYGLPSQSLIAWDKELQDILSLNLPHLSLYCLTIEPGTSFARDQKQGKLTALDDDLTADLYQCTQEKTTASCLPAYETSNHANAASSYSAHNMLYWQGEDWIGVGPGAHGRITTNGQRQELASHKRPQDYAQAVSKTGWGVQIQNTISPADDLAERVLLGLRLSAGINLHKLQNRANTGLNPQAMTNLIETGLLQITNDRLRATKPLLVDRIARELLL